MKLQKPSRLRAVAALLALAGCASAAHAAPFVTGDVFASLIGNVKEFGPTGTLKQTLVTAGGFNTGSAFDAAGNFYVTNFSANTVQKFDNNGTLLGNFGGGYATPEDVLVDAAGNVFVSSLSGAGLRKFNSAAVFQSSFATGQRIDWFDLNAGETVMYYTDESSSIHRWDLTTNTALTDLCTGCGNYALRLLGDGTLLATNYSRVNRINTTTGAVTQSYTLGTVGLFALNLDPDGTTFWTGSFVNDNLYRANIATGALVNSFNTGGNGNTLFGVSVFGERTQTGGGGGTVPEPSSILLLGSALLGLVFARKAVAK